MTYLSDSDVAGLEETVVGLLDTTCTIERAQLTPDAMGQRTRVWVNVDVGVPCRLRRSNIDLRTDENQIRRFGQSELTVPKVTDLRIGDRVLLGLAYWLVDTNPVPMELTKVAQVSLVIPEGADLPDSLAASAVTFVPGGTLVATDVQAALDELALEATLFERGTVVVNGAGIAQMDTVLWRAPYACHVTATRGFRVGGTGAIIRARKGALPLNVSDLSLVAAETWYVGVDIQNGTFASGDALVLEVVSVAGTVTELTTQVEFQRG